MVNGRTDMYFWRALWLDACCLRRMLIDFLTGDWLDVTMLQIYTNMVTVRGSLIAEPVEPGNQHQPRLCIQLAL